jgi:uncharacterized protein (DUF427 family)
MQAIWNDQVIAASDDTIVVDGNHYFPADSIRREFFVASDKKSICSWKGEASYYDIEVGGERNTDAAWYYPTPMSAAENITAHVAFWRGVEVS